MKRNLLFLIAILVVIVAIVMIEKDRFSFIFEAGNNSTQETGQTQTSPLPQQTQTQETLSPELKDLQSKNEKRLVDGCIGGKDCVPPIDEPKFVSAGRNAPVSDSDAVIGISYGNEAHAYPIKIMDYHEVVNDVVDGRAIIVTYCPLSGTAAAFEVSADGGDKTGAGGAGAGFGVSGKLLNSNLVLYDRKTQSLWSQMTGEALTGPQTGASLSSVPVQVMTYKEWLGHYPKTKILSADTGFQRDYETYPYGDYRENPVVYYPLEHEDTRLSPKTVVFGITMPGGQKAYPIVELLKALSAGGVIEDTIGGAKIRVSYKDGFFSAKNEPNNEALPFRPSFWFTWAAFYPQTELYKALK